MKERVVVAMSGGVDSSVTAALLKDRGYDVVGITMKTYDFDSVGGNVKNDTSCCGLDAVHDARMAAARIGIPHYVVDFREEFGKNVIENFVSEYMRGHTPNPCVLCNRDIKWGALLKKAESLGAQCIATGHYARVQLDEKSARYKLLRAHTIEKDQSYALWMLTQDALSRTMFPLGEMTKPEVRELARKFRLPNASKQESFEICFVADNDYTRFIAEQRPQEVSAIGAGEIVREGKVVGKHKGFPFYTIGQRKGIGYYGEKMYVTEIDANRNTIVIGRGNDLLKKGLRAGSVNAVSRAALPAGLRVQAKVRYKDEATSASIGTVNGESFELWFDEPKRAITPGQSVVIYEGEELVAGGIIEGALEGGSDALQNL